MERTAQEVAAGSARFDNRYYARMPKLETLSRDGIRVASILPGLFLTPMFDGLPPEAQKSLAAAVPFPSRLGKPAEYAQLATQICENVMLNGVQIRIDGAVRLAPK